MRDPAHLANRVVHQLFHRYFEDAVPRNLGLEAYAVVFRRLQAEGLVDREHTEDVLAEAVGNCYRHLEKHGAKSVKHPRAWFHSVCRHETARYLNAMALRDSLTMSAILEGSIELPNVHAWDDQERALRVLRRAMKSLPPRYQEFLHLDLVESLSHEEIQERMSIRSHGYFKKLKCEAFKALRQALMAVINRGIEAVL